MAQVQILAAAHFHQPGVRGMRGGADQNDKVWGIAKVGSTLVRFWGRRGGKMRFKTEINGMPHELLNEKLAKGYELMGANYQAMFTPTLAADMPSMYYSDLARGRVNTQH